jgi:hypothetical protein
VNLGKVNGDGPRACLVGRRGASKPGAVCVALVAAAALIAGCGGSSNTPAPTQAATQKASTTEANATPTTAGVSKTVSAASFADASNCKQLDGVGSKFSQAMEAASSGGKLNYKAAVKAYQQLADSAPSAIRPDIEAMAQSFASFASALGKSGYKAGKTPSPSQLIALESAAKAFNSSKLVTAEKDVEAWAVKNCS